MISGVERELRTLSKQRNALRVGDDVRFWKNYSFKITSTSRHRQSTARFRVFRKALAAASVSRSLRNAPGRIGVKRILSGFLFGMKILTTNDSNTKDVCKDVRVFAFFTTAHLAYRLVSTLASIEKTSDQKNTYRTLSSITVFLSLPLTVNDTEHQAGTNETPTQHQEDHFLITLTEAPSGPDELALSLS